MDNLEKTIQDLFSITQELEERFRQYGKKFTPDGHLIGSIGEVLVAEAYDLTLCGNNVNPVYDAVAKDGTEVQIKATQADRISISAKPEDEPQHLIAIHIQPTGKWSTVYNGPGALVWNAGSKPQKNGQRQISLVKLQQLMDCVPKEAQLPLMK